MFLYVSFRLTLISLSFRLSYDAATAKLDKVKGSKKEKERKEVEDEYERAKER